MFVWGWNKYGQLGIGSTTNQLVPRPLILDDHRVADMALGACHTLLLTGISMKLRCDGMGHWESDHRESDGWLYLL